MLGRMSNIIGDKSSGKTLLAIEACNNFAVTYPRGRIAYREAEAAFDKGYAEALGMPLDRIDFGKKPIMTVEDFSKDLEAFADASKEPGLYIVDSLDALSDDKEMERDIKDNSFGAAKAKKMSELFRKLIKKLEASQVCLIIISQVRDNIGVSFGEKYTRNGGKAMDFYASHCLWLAQIKKLDRTIDGIKRITGVQVKANCKKNKIGLPFRECTFNIKFGFGIDDIAANLDYLASVDLLNKVGLTKEQVTKFCRKLDDLTDDEYRETRSRIATTTRDSWSEVERKFLPTKRKY